MRSGSIVKHATATARRATIISLIGAAAIVCGFLVERVYFQHEIAAATDRLVAAHQSANLVLLADERLTMSANMASATGEQRWIDRYNANIPVIDRAISEAIELAPAAIAKRFDAETRVANDRLVELERRSFDQVRSGDTKSARATLDGRTYARFKKILSEGTSRFADGTIAFVTADVETVEQRSVAAICLVIVLSIAAALLMWRVIDASLKKSETAMLKAEQKIQTLAMNDLLTGLANRLSFREALHVAIARANQNGSKLSLLMIDLDKFKPINDRHGHLIGDLVLKTVAHRIERVMQAEGLRARFGGDEFVAVVEYADDDQAPATIGRRLVENLSEPMILDGLSLQIGASIGLAIYPTDGATEEDLIRKADIALYRAKHDGRGSVRLYDSTMDTDINEREKLEEELRNAISKGDIVPYFQPLVDLDTGELVGFEVLSRWHHPTRGVIQPATFIPLAEESGQIGALTWAVLREACRAAMHVPAHLSIAINISPVQIQDDWLAPRILAILKEIGFPPQRLEVELTEHALVSDLASAKRVISSLKALGIRIALDDFGTGYSSLCYLSELAFDKIKIDRSFIRTLHERAESAKVVNAIVGLGKSLGVSTIAEGVETERDADLLREIGCPVAQGFLYSKPVPAIGLAKLIAEFSPPLRERAVA